MRYIIITLEHLGETHFRSYENGDAVDIAKNLYEPQDRVLDLLYDSDDEAWDDAELGLDYEAGL